MIAVALAALLLAAGLGLDPRKHRRIIAVDGLPGTAGIGVYDLDEPGGREGFEEAVRNLRQAGIGFRVKED